MSTDQPTNPHRGSDFNDFMREERLTPTPRTDAIAHSGYNESVYIARMTHFARELELELADACSGWSDEIVKAQADMRRVEKDLNELRTSLLAERALADRLANCMAHLADYDWFIEGTHSHSVVCGLTPTLVRKALDAWKEARREDE